MGMMLLGFLRQLVLALLVFELRHLAAHGWRAIGAEVGCIEKEREALLRFKAALGNDTALVRWSSWGIKEPTRDCCQWEGVVCNNQTRHVIKLHLPADFPDFLVKGEIDASLMELQYLMYLNLSANYFSEQGSIPEFLGYLRHLRYLDLRNCRLSKGNIPTQLGLLSHLQYLDLSLNWFKGAIPYQLGNLSKLQYLNLSYNGILRGAIPYQLGNLSQLQYLDLSYNIYLGGAIPHQLGNLLQLTHLALSENNLTGSIPHQLGNLSQLQYLDLSYNYILGGAIPHHLGNLSQLTHLALSGNILKGAIPYQLGNLSQLRYLDLFYNDLEDPIPYEFASMMNSLENLDLGANKLKGDGLESLGHIHTLRHLNLESNLLSEDLSTILQSCPRFSLQNLDLSDNQITGTLVDLSIFPSLKNFDISYNLLNWTIPRHFLFPSSLVFLGIRSNFLKGVLTSSHLANLHNLKFLYLSDNLLTLRFSHNWVPPFQLEAIYVRSCKLGPDFPEWLQTQNNFTELDISNNGISGTIPKWFMGLLTPELIYLNVSCNNISGTIPDVAIKFTEQPAIFLASNQFEGSLPMFLQNAKALFLSNNNFSELHQFLCANGSTQQLIILDLSNNQFYGQLPNCWGHFQSLGLVDLSDNSFSGELPVSIGSLQTLWALILRNNEFSGDLFITLKNCPNLALLDAGENKISKHISSWFGIQLHELKILILRNNNISGSLSTHVCYFPNLHFLDLSFNNLSGQIPYCFQNFTPMAQKSSKSFAIEQTWYFINHDVVLPYDVSALLMWKGTEQIFEHNLFLKGIDLSSNKLVGNIPPELGMLVEMTSLNLSRNQLDGEIPAEIGQLTSLDYLDLSRNHLSGPIPSSLTQIDRLAMLDLSYNNLSGKIPTSTQLQSFDSSRYEGNVGLCGKPLEIKCPDEYEQRQPQESVNFQEKNDSIISRGFYWSMAFGFIFGFWGIFWPVLFNCSWRHMYFKFLNNLADAIYFFVVLNVTKCNRWIRGYLATMLLEQEKLR